jgi:mRNA interferase RelE/StbE
MTSIETWQLETSRQADKDLGQLDKPIKQRILNYFENRVLPNGNPRQFGKVLTGRLSGYWFYRVGDYRIIADIQDHRFTILAISIDHRRQIYDY